MIRSGMIFILSAMMANSAMAINLDRDGDNRLHATISKGGLNRITMSPWRIIQVTGDDSRYRLIHDDDGANIYLMPKVSVGEKIELSLKSDLGMVQDLELYVADIDGQLVSINPNGERNNSADEKAEITAMIEAMMKGERGKYYVRKKKRKIANEYGVEIKQISAYRYGDLAGGIFELSGEITNSSGYMTKDEFMKLFEGSKALAVQGRFGVISGAEKQKVYLVTRQTGKAE